MRSGPGALSARKAAERADRFQWPLVVAVVLLMWAEVMGRRGAGTRVAQGAQGHERRSSGGQDPSLRSG